MPLAIEVEPFSNYYPAEEYHQKYLDKNPGGYCHIGEAEGSKQVGENQDSSTAARNDKIEA